MRILTMISTLVVGAATVGCAYMPPVTLDATPADMELLAGRWSGEYASPVLGRRGTIEFKLEAATGKATGDVVMVPQGAGRPYGPNGGVSRPMESSPTTGDPQLLTITFVRAESDNISGSLDPYWDPDRNCYAHTIFKGRLVEQAIDGTFVTTFDCGPGDATGWWRVTRKAGS